MKNILIGAFALMTLSTAAFADTPPAGDAANPAYMWDLSDLYPSPQAWKAEHDKLKAEIDGLEKYKGTLGKSAAAMFEGLDAISKAHKEFDRLYVYASLKGDEDVRIAENQERVQLAQALGTRLSERTAWLSTEILAVGAKKVEAYEKQSPELKHRFDFFLDNTLRAAPHTLSPESEGVMAAASNVLIQPNNIYSVLSNGELPFPGVTLSDGTKVERLDQAAYTKYRQAPNRADRKLVFDTFWGTWKKYEGTFGSSLNTQVLAAEFDAKVRRYPNALSDALFADNMPEAVYRQLVAQANAGLPVFHRYLKLRKRLLGIKDDLGYYDIYPTMFTLDKPLHFGVDDAERIAFDVTAPYGPEYAVKLHQAFAGRWMDVLPRTGKASGAYMNGSAYDVHPYLHLNHNYDFESLSTFVHEWGHAVHTMLAHDAQPYDKANYSTFIAETASISNEMLLNDYMVAHARTKNEKLYYLGEGLELIRGTFFRQTMFGEFQLALHEEVEKGNALSGKRMTEIYCDLLKRYHGDAQGVMKIDPAYCVEWAFIPHFYYGFYVWQYATSMAGAAQFTDAIEHEGAPARDRYIAMLKAGGSDYAYELYKKAGIDMASPAPYQALVARMSRILDQIDALEAEK
ncbi:MAG: oligoendopeptidase F family protein [Alphaproteobacteria bacterium]|nr:oligoendopeptidase F family protein [Alphaproteobacteria bacterium]